MSDADAAAAGTTDNGSTTTDSSAHQAQPSDIPANTFFIGKAGRADTADKACSTTDLLLPAGSDEPLDESTKATALLQSHLRRLITEKKNLNLDLENYRCDLNSAVRNYTKCNNLYLFIGYIPLSLNLSFSLCLLLLFLGLIMSFCLSHPLTLPPILPVPVSFSSFTPLTRLHSTVFQPLADLYEKVAAETT
jgi:hypothetical protein